MKNLDIAIRILLIISCVILTWIVIQILLYKIEVPHILEAFLMFLINFNMLFFILLPVLVLVSLLICFKKRKLGLVILVINIVSCIMFFNGDTILQWIK